MLCGLARESGCGTLRETRAPSRVPAAILPERGSKAGIAARAFGNPARPVARNDSHGVQRPEPTAVRLQRGQMDPMERESARQIPSVQYIPEKGESKQHAEADPICGSKAAH